MPELRRLTNLRVSVQKMTETVEGGFVKQTYDHAFWIKVQALVPMTGDEIARFAGTGWNANWKAWTRGRPLIQDGSRIVLYDGDPGPSDSPPEADVPVAMYFEVRKGFPRAQVQELLLQEIVGADDYRPPPVNPDTPEPEAPEPILPPPW